MNFKLIDVLCALSVILGVTLGANIERVNAQERPKPGRVLTARGGGSNNGGTKAGSGTSDETLRWCNGAQGVLNQANDQAFAMVDKHSNYEGAYRALGKGMTDALDRTQGVEHENSLTYRSLVRGLDLIGKIDEATSSHHEDASFEYRYTFLARYYAFISHTIKSLDVPYYILGLQQPQSAKEYEESFINYAREEIQWLTGNYIIKGQNGEYLPVGSVHAYLSALELLVVATAEDIEDSLWSAKFECVSTELRLLGTKLAEHNTGNRQYYMNNPDAIDTTTPQIERMTASLKGRC